MAENKQKFTGFIGMSYIDNNPRMNCQDTINYLKQPNIELQEGMSLTFGDEELEAVGVVTYSSEEKKWVAVIDWNKIVKR